MLRISISYHILHIWLERVDSPFDKTQNVFLS